MRRSGSIRIWFMGTVAWDDETDFDPDILYLESVPVNEQVHP